MFTGYAECIVSLTVTEILSYVQVSVCFLFKNTKNEPALSSLRSSETYVSYR